MKPMPNLQKDGDPYTGEIYESKDRRDVGRRIRIYEAYTGLFGIRYRYVTVANIGVPELVGRKGSIRVKTLQKRWIKVSH